MTCYKDDIIEEVWRLRDAYVEQHHHNLAEIVADLQERQRQNLAKVVDRRNTPRQPSNHPNC